MATFSAERPQFRPGDFLGANNLVAIVDYLRTTTARQNLGQHSWGVIIGLNLVSQAITDTAVEYYVQPGVAIDGYGRIIVVNNPARIEAEQFVSISSGNVDVWIRYDQSESSATRTGFNVCSATDDYARINETFKIEIGSRSSILDRQSGVTVNDSLLVDAREALISIDPNVQILCDASVPHQQLPVDDDNAYWLIPLGHVKWEAASSSFLPLIDPTGIAPEQKYESVMSSRAKRRHIGVIAESVFAAEGIIRLRERTIAFDPDNEEIDRVCNELKIKNRDLKICDDLVQPKELIWLEGDTRITGDLRIFGKRLEFKDEEGRDYTERVIQGSLVSSINPLLIQRKERKKENRFAGSDLQVLLGDMEGGEARNRFSIGSILPADEDLCSHNAKDGVGKIFFEDNGRVGIGTYSPETNLMAPLTIRGLEQMLKVGEDEDPVSVMQLINFEGQGGDVKWQLGLGSDFSSLSFNESDPENSSLFLQEGGNVGVGTTEPNAKLDITQLPVSNGGSGLGTDLWFRIGDGGDGGRVWVEYGDQAAPLLVLSDNDDPPRIQFQQTDSAEPADDFSPAHTSWIGHAGSDSSDLAIMGGLLGVGTDNPDTQLTVQANGGGIHLYSGQNNGHFWVGFYTDGTPGSDRAGWLGYSHDGVSNFTIHNEKPNGDIILIPTRNVGVGTSTPSAKLDVRGDIRLGSTGNLFAMGSVENLRTIVGRVSASGNEDQGNGYTITKGGNGVYTIRFIQPFASAPVVVATMYNENEHIVSVSTVTSLSCQVNSRDMFGVNAGDLQDAAFTFIAIGER